MTFDMTLTFVTAAIDLACMFGGLFGMNVKIPLDGRKGAWELVVTTVLALSGLFLFILMLYKRRMEHKSYTMSQGREK